MPDKVYKAPNGTIVSETELKQKYGERFNSLVQDSTLVEVNDNVYKSPNGTLVEESTLKQKYGNRFDELVKNKTLTLDYSVKKKEPTQPTSESTSSGGSSESPKKNEAPINKKQQEDFLNRSKTLGDTIKGVESTVPKFSDSTIVKDIQSKNLTIANAEKQQQQGQARQERIEQEKGFLQSLVDTPVQALTSGVLNMVGGVSGLIGGVSDALIDKNPDAKYPIFSDKWIGRKIQQGGELENPSFGTNQWFRDTFMGASSTLSEIAGLESQDARKSIGVSDTSKSTIDHLLSGNIKDTGKSLVVDVIEQLPNIALMAGTGGSSASLGVVGASSAGSNLQEQYSEDQDISMTDLSQGIFMGITEVVTEKVFDLDIKGLSKIGGKVSDFLGDSGKAIKEKIAREGIDKVKGDIIRSTSDVFKQGAKGVKEEILEENIVTVVDYFVKAIDEDVFNQEGFEQLLKDMGQSTLVAAASGGGISTIAAKASQVNFTQEESIKIKKYNEILSNEDISTGTKDIATTRLKEINEGVATETSERYDKIIALPIEERVEILDKQATIEALEADKETTMDVEINSSIDEKIAELNSEIDAKINPKVEPALPSEISGFLTERNNETLSSVEQRMNNAELINEEDISGATTPLYDAIDGINNNENLSDADKQAAISLIEDKITKLESYEFETETKVIQPEQERPVLVSKQVIGKTTRGSKNPNEVTKERFYGKPATVNETDGVIVYDERSDVLSVVHDDGRTDLDFNYLEYQESSLDEDGNLQSVKLVDKRNGNEVSINDQDLAYDIAIKAKTQQLGEIQDSIFDEVYETVKQEAITREVVKDKTATGNSQQPPAPPVTPPVNTTQGTSQSGPLSTPEGAAKVSAEMIEEESSLILKFNRKLKDAKALFTLKKWVDRQSNVRKELERVGAKITESFMTNVAGAKAYADSKFERVEAKIYKDVSLEQEKKLDQIVFLKRVIQIDENFDKRKAENIKKTKELEAQLVTEKDRLKNLGKKPTLKDKAKSKKLSNEIKKLKANVPERPKHPKGFQKESAALAIEGIKREIGDADFGKLDSKSTEYFAEHNKLLEEQYKAGLINKETYERFKEDKYIQRRFLKYLLTEQGTNKVSPIAEKSLSKEQIKQIEKGDDTLLFTDSRVLLNAAMRSSAARIAQNHANRALAETFNDIKTKGLKNTIGKAPIYAKNAKGEVVVDAFGNKQLKEAETGYTNIFYFDEKGQRDGIQVKNKLAKEWLDVERHTSDFDQLTSKLLLNGVLKGFATGLNATFFLTNVPVDYINTILFTNVYNDTNIFNAGRKLAAAFTKNAYEYSKVEATGKSSDVEFMKDYTEWVENGGMMQFLTDQGRPDEVAKRDAEIRNKKSLKPLNLAVKGAIKTLAFTGEVSEKAMRLAIFRKAKENLLKEAGGSSKISDKQYKEILAQAAAKSRKVMDFSQGGLFGKKADVFLPYLNASIQGLRVSAEYVINNPVEFVGKLAQFSVPVASLMLYNLSVMDDDEELMDIPNYEWENYFIIMKPTKNEEGVRGYWRVKKHPSIQWFTNAIEHGTIEAYQLATGKDVKKGASFIDSEWETLNNALPIPLDWKKSLSRAPASLQAALAYVTNYDLFRDEAIVKDRDYGKYSPVLEGKYDKTVPLFYKELAEYTGASPKRSQAAVEKVITNPGTNAMLGLTYSLLDNMVEYTLGEPKKGMKSKYTDMTGKGMVSMLGGRLYREINPGYSDFVNNKEKEYEIELNTKEKEIKRDIVNLVTEGKDPKSYIQSLDYTAEKKQSLYNYAVDKKQIEEGKAKISDPDFYLDLKYTQKPELKAFLFFQKFGDADIETRKMAHQSARELKFNLFGNKRFVSEYNKLINEQKAASKSKKK